MEIEKNLLSVINSFSNKKILVIGDLILDIYLKGTSTRLSPEAPVPVVDVIQKTPLLGGAANTVCNLAALGAQVTYCTVIGDDNDGMLALDLLRKCENVNTNFIVIDSTRETISKTRVTAGSHVITRFDSGTTSPISPSICAQFIQHMSMHYDKYDAVIISDYDKGIITKEIITALVELQAQHAKHLSIDSKRLTAFKQLAPDLVKPNYEEALKLVDEQYRSTDRVAQMQSTGDRLKDETNSKIIILTLDSEGALVFENDNCIHVPALNVNAPHVAGAGDTYLSAFTLSLISGASINESGTIATAASTIAIRKEMTTACSRKELISYFNSRAKYIFSFKDLQEICDAYREEGKRIVLTNGCFDILHSGHVAYLHCAKELGDVLIVGVNTDESIRRIKGEQRPINPLADRLHVLAGLSAIDHVFPFGSVDDDTPIPVIKAVKPHVFAKGGDYTKEKLPEAETIESMGGEIVFLPHIPDHSTTEIINRINNSIAMERGQLQMEV